jgi:hypothetical protein
VKRFYRGTANGIHALNVGGVLTPVKVFVPVLATGIKEGDIGARFWILCMGAVAFESIAAVAGEPKIFENRFAALGYGNDVFDFKWTPHNQ